MPKIIFLHFLPRIFSSKNVAVISVNARLIFARSPFGGSLVTQIQKNNHFWLYIQICFPFLYCSAVKLIQKQLSAHKLHFLHSGDSSTLCFRFSPNEQADYLPQEIYGNKKIYYENKEIWSRKKLEMKCIETNGYKYATNQQEEQLK